MLKKNRKSIPFGFFIVSALVIYGMASNIVLVKADDTGEFKNEEGDTYINIYENTTWRKTDNLDFDKMITVYPGASLTIEKGAHINFQKDINGDDTYLQIDGGQIIANGTHDEPIRISADPDQEYFLIEFRRQDWEGFPDPVPSFLRHVEFSGGGHQWDTECPDCSAFWNRLILPAFAAIQGVPAVSYKGGQVHIENCRFFENVFADVGVEYDEFDSSTGTENYLEIVNSNFEKYGSSSAVRTSLYCLEAGGGCMNKIHLKDNWYDSIDGPYLSSPQNEANGKEVIGFAFVDGWRTSSMIADPVLVIPGIMGSAEVSGTLKMDPILHKYDDLIESLDLNGYTRGRNLYPFPYEWRDSNVETAKKLKERIDAIKTEQSVSKVDLVGHSMGGLVARQYIEDEDFENDVDQLITLGTPHHGSVKNYLVWESGEIGTTFDDSIVEHHFEMEALHNRYSDIYSYVQNEVPSVQELLPDYGYLFDVPRDSLRDYPVGYPKNTFLEDLNESESLANLKRVTFTNIIGVLDNDRSTISKIRVVDSTVEGRWLDGMPEKFYDENSDQGLEYGSGDATVPERSADDIPADKMLKSNSVHSDLPTTSQCAIFFELTGKSECESVIKTHIPNILLFNIFSPIDIQVVEVETGRRVGKDFSTGEILNEIPGAYYSGFETENELLTIPNPSDGKYKLITQGTGEGEYKIQVANITEDEGNPLKAEESVVEIIGETAAGQPGEKLITVDQDQILTDQADTIPPEIEISSPENKEYKNDNILPIEYEAIDASSGVNSEKTEIVLDGKRISGKTIDLSLEHLGEHTLSITVCDNAGNIAKKELSFSTSTNTLSMIHNVNHWAKLGLIRSKETRNYLETKLTIIGEKILFYRIVSKSFLPKKAKTIVLENIEKQIEKEIDRLVLEVESKKNISKNLVSETKTLLIESLQYIRRQY